MQAIDLDPEKLQDAAKRAKTYAEQYEHNLPSTLAADIFAVARAVLGERVGEHPNAQRDRERDSHRPAGSHLPYDKLEVMRRENHRLTDDYDKQERERDNVSKERIAEEEFEAKFGNGPKTRAADVDVQADKERAEADQVRIANEFIARRKADPNFAEQDAKDTREAMAEAERRHDKQHMAQTDQTPPSAEEVESAKARVVINEHFPRDGSMNRTEEPKRMSEGDVSKKLTELEKESRGGHLPPTKEAELHKTLSAHVKNNEDEHKPEHKAKGGTDKHAAPAKATKGK
jgi:hypothetical protein